MSDFPPPPVAPATDRLASIGQRALAQIIDSVIIGIPLFFVSTAISGDLTDADNGSLLVVTVLWLGVSLFYNTAMIAVHGATIGDGSLIGMGATILNGARIGAGCLVGAGALVTERKEFPDGSLIVGAPAKAVRQLDAAARAGAPWPRCDDPARPGAARAQRHRPSRRTGGN